MMLSSLTISVCLAKLSGYILTANICLQVALLLTHLQNCDFPYVLHSSLPPEYIDWYFIQMKAIQGSFDSRELAQDILS